MSQESRVPDEMERRALKILGSLLDCPPDEREAALVEACGGNTQLERRVRYFLTLESPTESLSFGPPPLPLPMSGSALDINDYRIIRMLGIGGMGEVLEAEQAGPGTRVALKITQAHVGTNPEAMERFSRGAQAMAHLQHANIVDVHGVGRLNDNLHFFVMDLVDGPNLQERISRGRVSPGAAARMVDSIAAAVHYAHENGIVHGDLKPSNILLQLVDRPILTDFGMFKPLDDDVAKLTKTAAVLEAAAYMAPEQADSKRGSVGPHTDVFGLGGLLYALLTGLPPFPGETLGEALRNALSDDPPIMPRCVCAKIPEAMEAICMRCLRKCPEERYETAAEVGEVLRAWLATEGHEPGS